MTMISKSVASVLVSLFYLTSLTIAKDHYDDYEDKVPPPPPPKDDRPCFYFVNFEIDPNSPLTPPGLVGRSLTTEFINGTVVPFAVSESKNIASCSHKTCFGFGDAIVKGETLLGKDGVTKHDVLKVALASTQPVTISKAALTMPEGPPDGAVAETFAVNQAMTEIKPGPPGAELGVSCPCATQKPTISDICCDCNDPHDSGECTLFTKTASSAVIVTAVAHPGFVYNGTEILNGCNEKGFHASFVVTCEEKEKTSY